MTNLTVLDKSGQPDFSTSLSKISLDNLKKGITFDNFNGKNCHVFGVKNDYKVVINMGYFDDIEISFGTLSQVKSYIKREMKK